MWEEVSTFLIVYRLEDLDGEANEGVFYPQELQHMMTLPEVFNIEKVLEGKYYQVLVKWKSCLLKFS